jgi:predicted lipid-binding transport protein (Tim44 family)
MGPIAGIAAGLGIAALMSHLGLSAAFGNFLVLLLVVIGVAFLLRLLFRRRAESAQGIQYRAPSLAGAGAGSARGPETVTFGGAAPQPAPAEPASYPPEFEPEPFLRQAKVNFVRLQEAYDKGDTGTLRDVMTREMFDEVSRDLQARGTHHPTGVVTLNAEIVEVVKEGDAFWASVRFTGLLREDDSPTPTPFDEVWNLTKPANGATGWLLAGIQQMQAA